MLHFLHKQDDSIPEISIGLSLSVIVAILAVATFASRGFLDYEALKQDREDLIMVSISGNQTARTPSTTR